MISAEFDFKDVDMAVDKAFDELDRTLVQAVNMAAKEVADEAKLTDKFNDQSGTLRASIMNAGATGKFSQENLGADVTYAAMSDEGYPYGIAINSGSRPHRIRARRRKTLRIPMNGGFIFPVSVWHPGTEATWFMDDALANQSAFFQQQIERAASLAFRRAGFTG